MLKVTQAPQGPILVGQEFTIMGTASTDYAGRNLSLIIDDRFQTAGPQIAADGIWRVRFVFQQAGNRRMRIAVGNEGVDVPLQVVTSLPPGFAQLQFLNPPTQIEAGQTVTLIGEANNYPEGAQLILRADQRFDLARPYVQTAKWQASVLFTQTGRRLLEIIGSGQDKAQIYLDVVAAIPQPPRLKFTTIPDRVQTGQTVVIAGEAANYPDGTQLLLRVDRTFEISRPTVTAQKWQAPVAFSAAGTRLLEIIASEQDKAEATIDVITPPQPPRTPRVSFTSVPSQLAVEQVATISGNAENYNDGAQLVLRVDQQYEVARPQVQAGKWQANLLLRQAGQRLVEIIGSEQDKAQVTITVVAPPTTTFRVFPRSTWTSLPTPNELPNLQPLRITLHHTALSGALSGSATQAQEISRMQLIRNSHVNGNGWSDVGYHFIVMPSGRVYEARSERKRGAHDVINDGLGVAFDGIYTSQTITQAQYEGAVALCTLLCKRYGINDPVTPVPTPTADFGTRSLPRICGHRDRVSTACPGTEGGRTVRLPEIRQAVRANL
ncbi:peptidoglycan recognition family protein [Pantanalinema rosaneae CENA516]|uniref:peptidoglycan recognition protein family protein n=1 Tax=Pantanalinema rosaneae TaxID=1620701 RepID=UPI003D6F0CFD